ncbi:MAG: translocation/assembly module TamB domain-containing protein [Deltaproteobacteria bacterium]|nr:translocation/assembly module TamB domain-containing protein [Deltaproteobacteria bacterium]
MRRAIRIGGVVLAALLGSVVLAVVAAAVALSNATLLARLVPRAAAAAGYEVRFSSIAHSLGRELEARDVVVAVAGQAPLVEARSLVLRYSLRRLLEGAIEITSLDVDTPAVHLIRLEDGSLAGFPPGAAESPPPDEGRGELLPIPFVRVGTATLRAGSVDLEDRAAAQRYDASGVELELRGNDDPRYLDARLGIASARAGTETLGPLTARGALDGGRISLAELALTGGGGELHGSGTYDVSGGAIDARLTLARLEPGPILAALGVTTELPRAIDGVVEARGNLTSDFTASARLTALYRDRPLTLDAAVRGAGASPRAASARLGWEGIVATADGALDLAGSANDVAVVVDADSLASLSGFPGLEELRGERTHLAARLSGELARPRVEVRAARIARPAFATTTADELRLGGAVELPDGPLDALVEIANLRSGDVVVGSGRIEAKGTLAVPAAHVELGADLRGDLRYDVAAKHAELHLTAPTFPLDPFLALAGLADASGRATGVVANVTGNPADVTSLRGTARIERLVARAEGTTLESARPITVDLAEQVATLDAGLRVGGSTLDASGTLHTADRALAAKVDGDVRLADLRGFARAVAPAVGRLGGSVSLHGTIAGTLDDPRLDARAQATGLVVEQGDPATDPAGALALRIDRLDARASGSFADLDGEIALPRGSARAAGRVIDAVEARAVAKGGAIEVTRLAAVVDGIPVEGRGRLARDRTMEASLDIRGAPLAKVPELAKANLGGTLTLAARASGTLARPAIEARVAVPELVFRERSLGALQANARLDGDDLSLTATLPQGATATAKASFAGARRFGADVEVPGLDLEPLLALAGASLPPALGDAKGRLAALAHVTGELSNPRALAGTVTISALELSGAGQRLTLTRPAVLELAGGALAVDELALDLGGSGTVTLAAHGAPDDLDGTVNVDLDPQWANAFLDGTELGQGRVTAAVRVHGAPGAVAATGPLEAAVSSIATRGVPAGISDLTATVNLATDRAELTRLAARVGDGEIHGTAVADLRTQSLERASLDFVELPYRIPDTLRVLASGHLEGRGSRAGSEIGGEVRIDDALYERDVEMFAGLVKPLSGAPTARSARKAPSPLLDRIHLAIKVSGPETMVIRNNVAHAILSADLSVAGTVARPELLGEVDVAEGTLMFFDNDFEVSRGAVVFDNPSRIDPRVDFEASSIVDHTGEDVTVRLGLEGVASRGLALTLDSEPPYAQDDLVFLLATGKTRGEALAGGGGGPGVTGLSLGALDFIGGKLAKKHFGLSEFGVSEGESGGTRVTVGKRLSDRMEVRVVDEIGRDTNLALNVEYQVTDRLVVVAVPQSSGAFAAEIRLRFEVR